MSGRKKKLPGWAVCLIGLAVCNVFFLIGFFVMDWLGDDSVIAAVTVAVPGLGMFGFAIALIARGIQALAARVTRKAETAGNALPYRRRVFRADGAQADSSWPMVIAMLVLVFPLGLYYLIAKTQYEKHAYTVNGLRLLLLGGFALLGSVPFVYVLVQDGPQGFLYLIIGPPLTALVSFIWGPYLLACGRRNDRLMTLLTVEKITNVDRIAALMHKTPAKIFTYVRALIDSELLMNAYISYRDREIIIKGISEKEAFYCKNCGGTTVLQLKEPKICDYCGGEL